MCYNGNGSNTETDGPWFDLRVGKKSGPSIKI